MALTTWQAYSAANPDKSKLIPHAGLWAKGIGVTDFYALEVNTTTGALTVNDISGGGGGGGGITSGGVEGTKTVSAAVILAAVGGSNLAGRSVLTIFNVGPDTIYWGFNVAVSASTGTPMLINTGISLAIADSQDVYLVSSPGSNDARITEAI